MGACCDHIEYSVYNDQYVSLCGVCTGAVFHSHCHISAGWRFRAAMYHDSCFDLIHFAVVSLLQGGMTTAAWERVLFAVIRESPMYRLDARKRERVLRLCRHQQIDTFYLQVGQLIAQNWKWENIANSSLRRHRGARILADLWAQKHKQASTKLSTWTGIPGCVCVIIINYVPRDWLVVD